MIRFTLFLYLLIASTEFALGSTVSGNVKDAHGDPIPGVNVYIKGTYDGATTQVDGAFLFDTYEEGQQTLVASFIGYKTSELVVDLDGHLVLSLTLKEEVSKLSGVVITAGAFEASDEGKSVVLKPLDIAMTAGATADIAGALNTLPGTTTNGESGRLFVRGGTSAETRAFIDGVLVDNFYNASANSIPSRSRFSPFLFKGTYFSTGGYSAEYGQALSSVLALNSTDIPDQTQSDISIMSVGGDIAHTKKWKDGSVYGQFQYTNLDPYQGLVSQVYDWEDGYTSENSTMMVRQKLGKSDMLKVYANYDHSAFIVNIPNINHLNSPDRIDTDNKNLYFNSSYKRAFGSKTNSYVGFSYGKNYEKTAINSDEVSYESRSLHAKTYLSHDPVANLNIKVGSELIELSRKEDVRFNDNPFVSRFQNVNTAAFAEVEYYASNTFTIRAGIRSEHYSLLDELLVSPRLSVAGKSGEFSKVSLSYGRFHQLPDREILLRSDLVKPELADHYLLNYQRSKDGRTIRLEGYIKDYNDLIKIESLDVFDPKNYSNSGSGYARGIDLFWRDSKLIKNGDYWISYSYIDTKRDYRNFPTLSTPTFAAKHNLSIVYKHFLTKLKTQIGGSFNYNSGRPYNDPNVDEFNGSKTKHYANLSFNFAYLMKQNIIIYGSATNLLGRDNIFSYQYEDNPGQDGVYDALAVGQPAKRFIFLGVFITFTKDKTKNQLENL